MTRPVRLQLSRKRGFNLQAHSRAINDLDAVKVDRSTHWGNPFRIDEPVDRRLVSKWDWKLKPGRWDDDACGSAEEAVHRFRYCFSRDGASLSLANKDLRGFNLACWCHLCPKHAPTGKPFDEPCPDCAPCHADVLGRRANGFVCEEIKPC